MLIIDQLQFGTRFRSWSGRGLRSLIHQAAYQRGAEYLKRLPADAIKVG